MNESAVQNHYRLIRRVLLTTLALNWAVSAAKIAYGIVTGCSSMTADGFHSLSDGASNIVGIIGIHFACQPRDPGHPYGHRKYETFFSLSIAMLLFFVAIGLVHGALERIGPDPVVPRVDAVSFAIMVATMCVNGWVAHYEKTRGRALKSDILLADSRHTHADILVSVSVIVTLIFIRLGFPLLDPIATMAIAIFIIYSGYAIVKESSAVLCDSAAIVDVNAITSVVTGVQGVRTCHKIRTRGRPDDIHIDLHVQVAPNMHMNTAHKISYEIEEAIRKRFPGITDVIVHMEPAESAG